MKNLTTKCFSRYKTPIAANLAKKYMAVFYKFFSEIAEIEKELVTKHAAIIISNESYSDNVQGAKLEKAMPIFLQLLEDTIEQDPITPVWLTHYFLDEEICFFPVNKITQESCLELKNLHTLSITVDEVLAIYLNRR